MHIPFNKPYFQGKELEYIQNALKLGRISGDGKYTKLCQSWIESHCNTPQALLTTSCTDALELAAILIDIQEGDEVIVPSYTFVSTVNPFVLRGAKPIFVDIRPDTLNIDEKLVSKFVNKRTKAIVPVHYAGVGCEMDSLRCIAQDLNIALIEDNAHGFLGTYKGQTLGTIGDLGTQSFHETKNISCGEGGALLINNPAYSERAEILREKGTNRSQFFRGQVDKYNWVDIGSSFLPSDILAAFLYAQLENFSSIQKMREKIWTTYTNELKDWAQSNSVQLPSIPDHCEQTFHMFYIVMPNLSCRTRFIDYLKNEDINAVFHYQDLNTSPMGQRFGGKKGDCPVSEKMSECLVRLPFYNDFCLSDQSRVIEKIKNFSV